MNRREYLGLVAVSGVGAYYGSQSCKESDTDPTAFTLGAVGGRTLGKH